MKKTNIKTNAGFTLPELLSAVAIAGTLSSIALPSYLNQVDRLHQREAQSLMTQAMTALSTYNDEFGEPAKSWKDLDKVSTIMAENGPATESNFNQIAIPGKHYWLDIERNGNHYKLKAWHYQDDTTPEEAVSQKYNVIGCLNVSTGASMQIAGDSKSDAQEGDLKCLDS